MHSVAHLALLAGVATAIPAAVPAPAWENWAPAATTTTPPPPPTTTALKAGWASWGYNGTQSRSSSSSKSSSTWATWSNTTTASPSHKWANWQPQSLSSAVAAPSVGGGNKWSAPSDPYNLWAGGSGGSGNAPSQGWQNWNNGADGSGAPGGGSNGATQTWSSWNQDSDDNSPLDPWFRQRPPPNAAVPTQTLLPASHWSQNGADIQYVKPSDSCSQYYKPDAASKSDVHQFAWLTSNFTADAVLLDHSTLMSYTYVKSSGALQITFSSDEAFSVAKSTWHTGQIMVLYDGTCGPAMNCYAICQQLTFDSSSKRCTMSTKSANYEDIVSYFTFDWGNYQPGKGRPGKGRPGKSSTTTIGGSTTSSGSTGSTSGITSTSGVSGSTTTTSSTSTTTTVAPGNYTFGEVHEADDCTAPKDTKYGLPTACLGQYFDFDLDDSYDYNTIEETDLTNSFKTFPHFWYDDADDFDLDAEDYSDDDAVLDLDQDLNPERRGLAKRWEWSDLNPLPAIKSGIKAVLPPIQGLTAPYDIPLINQQFPLNIPKERTVVPTAPWKNAVLIKDFNKKTENSVSKLELYCVDCGASGTATIAGSIGVSALEGVDYVRASLDMNLAIGLKLGLVADFEYTKTINEPLFIVPLTPLTIGVASIGPFLKAGAEIDLKLKAQGKVLGGGSMNFNEAKVALDVTNFSGTSSGWTPSFDPVFEADGEIAASAEFGVPISIALGINVLKYSADVSLVERPGILAKAQAAVSANLDGAGFVAVDGCKGISAGIDFKNDVYVQFTAGTTAAKKVPLFAMPNKSLFSTCIGQPVETTTTTTTTDGPEPTDEPTSTTTDGGDEGTTTTTADESDPTTTDDGGEATTTTDDGETATTTADDSGSTDTEEKRAAGYFKRHDVETVYAQLAKRQNTTTDDEITDVTADTITKDGQKIVQDFVVPDTNELNYTRTDGYYFANLIDTEAVYQAYACSNGNIHIFGLNDSILASDCQEDFAMHDDDDQGRLVLADGYSRMMVYYPDEMAATGVSRIRLQDIEELPKGVNEIVLFPQETSGLGGKEENAELYFAVNPAAEVFYPIVCSYTNTSLYSKLFIAQDLDAGIAMLKDPALKYSITGGDVSDCYFMPLMDGSAYDTDTDNGGLFTDVDDDEDSTSTTTTTSAGATTTVTATTTTTAATTTTTSAGPVVTDD